MGWLGHLIGEYKMHAVRAEKPFLCEVLDETLKVSVLHQSKQVVVVPLPTIRRHVRERGFDHTAELAKGLARQNGWKMEKMLGRAVDSVQVGSGKAQRKSQAKRAYELLRAPDLATDYLLLDDIWTTGASLLSAIELFAQAGVAKEHIFGAVIALSK